MSSVPPPYWFNPYMHSISAPQTSRKRKEKEIIEIEEDTAAQLPQHIYSINTHQAPTYSTPYALQGRLMGGTSSSLAIPINPCHQYMVQPSPSTSRPDHYIHLSTSNSSNCDFRFKILDPLPIEMDDSLRFVHPMDWYPARNIRVHDANQKEGFQQALLIISRANWKMERFDEFLMVSLKYSASFVLEQIFELLAKQKQSQEDFQLSKAHPLCRFFTYFKDGELNESLFGKIDQDHNPLKYAFLLAFFIQEEIIPIEKLRGSDISLLLKDNPKIDKKIFWNLSHISDISITLESIEKKIVLRLRREFIQDLEPFYEKNNTSSEVIIQGEANQIKLLKKLLKFYYDYPDLNKLQQQHANDLYLTKWLRPVLELYEKTKSQLLGRLVSTWIDNLCQSRFYLATNEAMECWFSEIHRLILHHQESSPKTFILIHRLLGNSMGFLVNHLASNCLSENVSNWRYLISRYGSSVQMLQIPYDMLTSDWQKQFPNLKKIYLKISSKDQTINLKLLEFWKDSLLEVSFLLEAHHKHLRLTSFQIPTELAIQKLELASCELDSAVLTAFSALPKLKSLSLEKCIVQSFSLLQQIANKPLKVLCLNDSCFDHPLPNQMGIRYQDMLVSRIWRLEMAVKKLIILPANPPKPEWFTKSNFDGIYQVTDFTKEGRFILNETSQWDSYRLASLFAEIHKMSSLIERTPDYFSLRLNDSRYFFYHPMMNQNQNTNFLDIPDLSIDYVLTNSASGQVFSEQFLAAGQAQGKVVHQSSQVDEKGMFVTHGFFIKDSKTDKETRLMIIEVPVSPEKITDGQYWLTLIHTIEKFHLLSAEKKQQVLFYGPNQASQNLNDYLAVSLVLKKIIDDLKTEPKQINLEQVFKYICCQKPFYNLDPNLFINLIYLIKKIISKKTSLINEI